MQGKLESDLPPIGSATSADRVGVCLLVDDLTPDAGTERQVEATVLQLSAAPEFDVHVCCFADSDRLRRLASCAQTAVFPVVRIYTPSAAGQMLRFRQYLRQHRIHVVHSWMVNSNLFGAIAAAKSGACVVTSRLNQGYWHTPALLRAYALVNHFTHRVFANSEGARRVALETENLSADKIDVIYNGVDVERYAPSSGNRSEPARQLGVPDSARVVGIVANLRPVKDLPLFLRSAAIAAARIPDVVFLIVGRGDLEMDLRKLAGELGIHSRVFFTGGHGAVEDYLSRMSVACLTSHSEGFSNAILEYMAAGLPVVATDVGGNAEAIAHNESGYIVTERTPEAFAAPVIRLLEDEQLRAAMASCSLERCHRLFSMDVYGERMRRYYRDIASSTAMRI